MLRNDALRVFSWIFAPIDEDTWIRVCRNEWASFIELASRESGLDACCDTTVSRLADPPSYEEKARFSSRHFTGGLPESAPPIESLYVSTQGQGHESEYFREPAWYMRDLAESMGLSIPSEFVSYPDHLSIELGVASLLWGTDEQSARDFSCNRFGWLRAYGERLSSIGADASFYVAAVEVLAGMIDAWRMETGSNEKGTREER